MPHKDLYQKLYEDPDLNYGQHSQGRCPGARSFPHYKGYLFGKVIDIGCGTGDTVKILREAGFEADGVDQIDLGNGMFVSDAATFDCSSYDTAVCIDVLEHMEESEVIAVLKSMSKAKRQIIQVHCGPSKENKYNTELHINQKRPDEWCELIKKYLTFQHKQQLSPRRVLIFAGDTPVRQERFEIPKSFNMRCFWNDDGSFFIPRNNKRLEQYLDDYCIKVSDRTYFPPIRSGMLVEELKDKYKGQTCYIIGKGPSLDHLTAEYFKAPGPIFCINDSIHCVPRVPGHDYYVFQSDLDLKEECRPTNTDDILVLHYKCQQLYTDYVNRYFFHNRQLLNQEAGPTASICVMVSKIVGCVQIKMLCLDACVNKKTAYAKSVGYESDRWGKDPTRFLTHRQRIDKFLAGTDHEWIIPGDQSSHESSSSDTPQQLSDNLALHHEPDHKEHRAALIASSEKPLKRGRVHHEMIVDHLDIKQQS